MQKTKKKTDTAAIVPNMKKKLLTPSSVNSDSVVDDPISSIRT